MTLREFGQSASDFWQNYLTEITTQHILDWSIGNLAITLIGGFIAFTIGMALVSGVAVILWIWFGEWYKTISTPTFIDRLDKKFGVFYSGVIMTALIFGVFAVLAVLASLAE